MHISILGSGGWGTALGLLLLENGHQVTLWSKFQEEADTLHKTRQNRYLPGVDLPAELSFIADLSCVKDAELVVLVVPSFAIRETFVAIRDLLSAETPVVIASKGIERGTSKTFFEIGRDELGADQPLAILSGPSHAEEVARRVPTACVAASDCAPVAELVQDVFMNERFRVYTSIDIIGVELGGALKNIIAVAAGISDGLGYGDNTMAALMTRGLDEMATLAVSRGGSRETLAGLTGLGDLIVTCTSKHSRNRRAGQFIGQGYTTQEAMDKVGAVVEGYYATAAAIELARPMGISLPIIEELYRVLYEDKCPKTVLRDLMSRSKRAEHGGAASARWVSPN